MEQSSLVARLFEQLSEPFTAGELFDHMPDIVFFIKNAEGRYVLVNQTLVERCGKRHKSEVIGCTPSQVLGSQLGKGYETQDRDVLRSGQQLLNQLELHVFKPRRVGWCLTSKFPLASEGGAIVGLMGVSRDLKMPDVTSEDFEHISAAVQYAEAHLDQSPGKRDLAEIACMTPYQLDRRMKRVYGMPVGKWLLKTRIDRASSDLADSELPIAQVALRAGYTDQSAFTRQFRRATGFTPSEFRKFQQDSTRGG